MYPNQKRIDVKYFSIGGKIDQGFLQTAFYQATKESHKFEQCILPNVVHNAGPNLDFNHSS